MEGRYARAVGGNDFSGARRNLRRWRPSHDSRFLPFEVRGRHRTTSQLRQVHEHPRRAAQVVATDPKGRPDRHECARIGVDAPRGRMLEHSGHRCLPPRVRAPRKRQVRDETRRQRIDENLDCRPDAVTLIAGRVTEDERSSRDERAAANAVRSRIGVCGYRRAIRRKDQTPGQANVMDDYAPIGLDVSAEHTLELARTAAPFAVARGNAAPRIQSDYRPGWHAENRAATRRRVRERGWSELALRTPLIRAVPQELGDS